MFEKDRIAIDIGTSYTKVMVGNKARIKQSTLIRTPEDCIVGGKIVDLEALKNALLDYLTRSGVKAKDVMYSIHGQDIILRHTEIPAMDEKSIGNSVEWEIKQYLPANGENHYIDFQVIDKPDKEKKVLKVLMVAVPREKVDTLIQLSDMMGLNTVAIDVAANCMARVLNAAKVVNNVENVGIIDIGYNTSSITILNHGKLAIEREVPFGIITVTKELADKLHITNDEALAYLTGEDFNLLEIDNNDDETNRRIKTLVENVVSTLSEQDAQQYLNSGKFNLDNLQDKSESKVRIKAFFDSVFLTFSRIVQFYSTGKTNKKLDVIYITGGGTRITGIEEYTAKQFDTKVFLLDTVNRNLFKTKIPDKCSLVNYINTLGLLFRKE